MVKELTYMLSIIIILGVIILFINFFALIWEKRKLFNYLKTEKPAVYKKIFQYTNILEIFKFKPLLYIYQLKNETDNKCKAIKQKMRKLTIQALSCFGGIIVIIILFAIIIGGIQK